MYCIHIFKTVFSVRGISTVVSLCTSSSSLKTVKGPSYSGFGVNSKSSMFSETISLFVIKNPFQKKHKKYETDGHNNMWN